MSVRHINNHADSDADLLHYEEAPQSLSARIERSARGSLTEQLPYLILALYPTMFKIPDLPGIPNFLGRQFLEVMSSAPLVLVILLNLILGRGNVNRYQVPFLLACLFFLGIQLVSLLRYAMVEDSHRAEAIRMGLGFSLIAAAAFSFVWNSSGEVLKKLVTAATHGLFVFLSLNILLYLAGVRASDEFSISHEIDGVVGRNAILSVLGIGGNRVRFPMATGINSFGLLSGASLLLGLFRYQQAKLYGTLVISVSLLATVLTDTRSALLFAFLSFIFCAILNTRYRGQFALLAFVMPFVSFVGFPLLAMATPLLEKAGLGDSAFRGSADQAKGNVRMSFYRVVFERALESPEGISLGYGYMGHKTSGAALAYSAYMTDTDDRRASRRTPHNGILSMLLDNGLLGVAGFLGLTAGMIRSLMSSSGSERRYAMGLLSYILLCGATEAVPTLYFFDMLWVYLLILAGSLAVGTESSSHYILTEQEFEHD